MDLTKLKYTTLDKIVTDLLVNADKPRIIEVIEVLYRDDTAYEFSILCIDESNRLKIEAIKAVRSIVDLSLQDAKYAVEETYTLNLTKLQVKELDRLLKGTGYKTRVGRSKIPF